MTGDALLDAALAYADEGFAIFPCSDTKTPLTAHGFDDASTDEQTIASWFEGDRVACIGLAVPEGVIVVDVDPRNGGSETVKALRSEHGRGAFPSTRKAKTGGNGYHLWYEVDPDLRLRSKLGEGIDVKRAGRGYVIVPPSRTVLGEYTWANDLDVAPAPAWMVAALVRPDAEEREYEERDAPAIPPFMDGTAYGEAALRLELERLRDTSEGGRNDALNGAAFSLAQLVAGGELKEEPVVEQLRATALDIGLEEGEVDLTLESAITAGLAEPRNAPERPDRAGAANPTSGSPASILDVLDAQNDDPDDDAETRFWLDWSEDVPEDAFILYPMLPRSAYVLVYGAAEAVKSMAFVALGAEASRRGFDVSVYSLENPPNVDRSRVRRFDPDPEHFRLTNQLLNLADPAQALAMMERERGRDLVIIDTYSHAYAQRFDSGDGNAKAIEFARVIRWLMRKTGATFVVIDHTGFERLEEPRDASAKRQQVDIAIGMERTRDWQLGQPAHFSMHNYKSARFANPFHLAGLVVGTGDEPLRLEWGAGAGLLEWGTA